MKFFIVNLGCRVNRVESDSFIAQLQEHGWILSSDDPDVVLVNTCTVTGEADKKTRKAVRHALREHKNATVIVTGCAAAMTPDVYLQMDDRIRVVAKNAAVETALALDDDAIHGNIAIKEDENRSVLESNGTLGSDSSYSQSSLNSLRNPSLRVGQDFPTRVGIKIQDGCDNACTYCIVHTARGKSVSTPLSTCLADAKRQYEAGAREIVLTGIDLGNYSYEGLFLSDLVRQMLELMPEARIRISSIEPPSINCGLIDLMAQSDGRVCRHLHIPLQSGSSKVLREMDRRYSAEDYVSLVDDLYQSMPSISLSTDIIVGFPGETEDDFQHTLSMVRRCRFGKVHIFRYSRRAGTPAAVRVDQVQPEIIADRAKRLKSVADEVRRIEQRKRLGASELILVEQKGMGTSESFYPVVVDDAVSKGLLHSFTLKDLREDGVFIV